MNRYQVGGLISIGLVIFALFLTFIPEGQQILLALEDLGLGSLGVGLLILKIARFVALLTTILALTGVLGGILGGIILLLDENWEPMRDVGGTVHVILAFIFSLSLGGIVQVKLVPWIVMAPWAPWVYWLFALLSGGRIFYETISIPWFVYGMVVFWVGYITGDLWKDIMVDLYYYIEEKVRRLMGRSRYP